MDALDPGEVGAVDNGALTGRDCFRNPKYDRLVDLTQGTGGKH
jgi:hypothetical protein